MPSTLWQGGFCSFFRKVLFGGFYGYQGETLCFFSRLYLDVISADYHKNKNNFVTNLTYPVVMKMFDVGPAIRSQFMAEIGDIRCFHSKKTLVAFAGEVFQPRRWHFSCPNKLL